MARKSEKTYRVRFINNNANTPQINVGSIGQCKMLPEHLYERCVKLKAVELLNDKPTAKKPSKKPSKKGDK